MMRSLKLTAFAAVAMALLPACTTVEKTSFDSRLNAPKTFQFLPDKTIQTAGAAEVSNAPYWHQKLEEAIAANLEKKGYREVKAGSHDLWVAVHVIDQYGKNIVLLDNYSGYKLSAKERGEQQASLDALAASAGEIKGERHTLVVDVIDPVKREVIWRELTFTTHKTGGTAKNRQKAIDRAVAKVLANFPN